MKPFKLLIFAGIGLVLFYFFSDLIFSDSHYVKVLEQERTNKDLSFRSKDNSPLADEDRLAFEKLTYYKPDRDYRVNAEFERFGRQDTVQMQMTGQDTTLYVRIGQAAFSIDGEDQSLIVFQKVGDETNWFVPFTDKTNGFFTYGGGRYLDVPVQEGKRITLDFNRAYNPFCAYNHAYSCPVPPASNRLTVEIPAGEKAFAK